VCIPLCTTVIHTCTSRSSSDYRHHRSPAVVCCAPTSKHTPTTCCYHGLSSLGLESLYIRDVHETFSAETETRPRRDVVSPRRDWDRDVTSCRDVWWKAVSSSPQVTAYRDNWSGIRAKHVACIIWAFYGLVNAVVGLPRTWYWFLSCRPTSMLLVPHCHCWLRSGLTSLQQSVCVCHCDVGSLYIT